jgi:uncharacterized membrane protein
MFAWAAATWSTAPERFPVHWNLAGGVDQHWFVGIRTPWTLSSERFWTLTHRFGGRLFVAIGLALIAAGLIRAPWALILVGAVLFGGVVWTILYSYLIWRGDPNRVPPAGAPPQ